MRAETAECPRCKTTWRVSGIRREGLVCPRCGVWTGRVVSDGKDKYRIRQGADK